jgi:hypothetical protein
VAQTVDGAFAVDLETDEVSATDESVAPGAPLDLQLPLVVTAAAVGSTVVAIVARRPPLVVSHDAGTTWREAGGGLPPGKAVAIDEDNPDRIVYAARNRLYLSEDGGRFWRALVAELPEIEAVALDY